MADYKKIIRSPHFTFLVGQEQAPLTIHSAVVQDLSKPLFALINNGLMKESTTGVGSLDDVKAETFIAFCEYAYTGAYVTPSVAPNIGSLNNQTPTKSPEKTSFSFGGTPVASSGNGNTPRTSGNLFGSSTNASSGTTNTPNTSGGLFGSTTTNASSGTTNISNTSGGLFTTNASLRTNNASNSSGGLFGATTTHAPNPPRYTPLFGHSTSNSPSLSGQGQPQVAGAQVKVTSHYDRLWEQFQALYHTFFSTSVSDPDIVFHATVYVFATRYLIEPLRQQCLKSLHRDLCNFPLDHKNASLVLDLLDFTYTYTGRYEPGGKSPLRNLVIHYVACKAQTLGDNERFMEILDSNGEIGSDLVAKLVK